MPENVKCFKIGKYYRRSLKTSTDSSELLRTQWYGRSRARIRLRPTRWQKIPPHHYPSISIHSGTCFRKKEKDDRFKNNRAVLPSGTKFCSAAQQSHSPSSSKGQTHTILKSGHHHLATLQPCNREPERRNDGLADQHLLVHASPPSLFRFIISSCRR